MLSINNLQGKHMIRKLVESDIEDAFKIAILKPIRKESDYLSLDSIISFILDEKNLSLGYFEGNELITWAAVRFGQLHGEKIWCIIYLFTKRFSDHFSFKTDDFGLIMDEYFRIAEENEYYSYVYSVPKKSQRSYYRKWKSVEGRYLAEDLEDVPAGTLPSEEWMRRLNGGIRAYDSVIKKRTLKHEYRKPYSLDAD